jgi:hypothetical protein
MQTNIIFRCEPLLKAQAERVAKARDATVSQVLRRALRKYSRAKDQLRRPRRARNTARRFDSQMSG